MSAGKKKGEEGRGRTGKFRPGTDRLVVATYNATDAFRAIKSHVAVAFDVSRDLVAVTGPAGDEGAEGTACFFAAAPEAFDALVQFRVAYETDDELELQNAYVSARAALAKAWGES
jgi:hypothetical protein